VTTALIVLLAAVLAGLVILPVALPGQADALPDDRDPETTDLGEERDALLGAIRELDARDDLPKERRDELRARYEAKAARVLRALDEQLAESSGQPARQPLRRLRANWGVAVLLVVSAGVAATLGGYVLPRVGPNATVTTSFADDLAAAERIRELRRSAERDPSGSAWSAVGDAYWAAQGAEGAFGAYTTAIEEYEDAPARAYQRLALLSLSSDVDRARVLLEQARLRAPDDPNTLGTLGELYLQTGEYAASLEAFEALAALPTAANDPLVAERVELLRTTVPRAEATLNEPSAATFGALADTLWNAGALDAATREYFRLLTRFDPEEPVALARVGQVLFREGRNDDALMMLQRARATAAERQLLLSETALLFLGNAAFASGDYGLAIDAWEDHLAVAPDPGRVPQLIERARALQAGLPDPGLAPVGDDVQALASGPELFQASCAVCHGPQGRGGSGPPLAGNPAAGRPANVADLIRFGRGLMPGFQAQLSPEQILTLRDWVVDTFGP